MTSLQEMFLLATLLTFAMALPAPAQVFKTIASFTRGNGANFPLAQGTDGNFYGTQDSSLSSVFRVTPAGDMTLLHDFDFDSGGYYPLSGLILAADGRFYGTTAYSHPSDGTVFSISSDGAFRTLYYFCPQPSPCVSGELPVGALLQIDNGLFYGTTDLGGDLSCNPPFGCGTVFRIASGGSLTTLHRFHLSDGLAPMAPLIEGFDGTLYGTASSGGIQSDSCAGGWSGCGTLFKTTPSGDFSTLHRFCSQRDCADGWWPGTVIEGADGSLYGVTASGGCGTIYKFSEPGPLTTLHTFVGADGCNPLRLVQATDGDFYGVTQSGGSSSGCGTVGCGTVFSITPEGKLTTLHTFCAGAFCLDGAFPIGLIQATDGKFYGSTFVDGPGGGGTIFSLDLGLRPFVSFIRAAGKVGETRGILGQGFTGTTAVSFNETSAQFTVVSDTFIKAVVPEGATTGYVTVTTPTRVFKSNVPFHVIP